MPVHRTCKGRRVQKLQLQQDGKSIERSQQDLPGLGLRWKETVHDGSCADDPHHHWLLYGIAKENLRNDQTSSSQAQEICDPAPRHRFALRALTGTRAAARGGVTTVIDFAIPYGEQTLVEAYETWMARAQPKACVDYCFHIAITNWDRHGPEMKTLVESYGAIVVQLLSPGVPG